MKKHSHENTSPTQTVTKVWVSSHLRWYSTVIVWWTRGWRSEWVNGIMSECWTWTDPNHFGNEHGDSVCLHNWIVCVHDTRYYGIDKCCTYKTVACIMWDKSSYNPMSRNILPLPHKTRTRIHRVLVRSWWSQQSKNGVLTYAYIYIACANIQSYIASRSVKKCICARYITC